MTATTVTRDKPSLVLRLRDSLSRHAQAPAVEGQRTVLSYAELERRSAALARSLRDAGVCRGDIVPLLMGRSPQLVIAQLAVLRLGAAYAPIDLASPAPRQQAMLQVLRSTVIVTDGATPSAAAGDAVVIDANDVAQHPADDAFAPWVGDDPNAAACVMFTSGTTGAPKGVVVPQSGIARLVCDADFAELQPRSRWGFLSSPAFDASTLEVWAPLLNGGCCVAQEDALPSLDDLANFLLSKRITDTWLTAALFNAMVEDRLDAFGELRQLLTGGERVSPRHAQAVLKAHPTLRLVNGYGPTENTTFTLCRTITWDDTENVAGIPIGQPIRGTTVRVGIDAQETNDGELLAGGAGVALGYLNEPELSAQKFIVLDGRRWYRTGDLVHRRADGAFEFRGRVDRQVKIQGHRVELEEVETLLRSCPGVGDAAVLMRGDSAESQHLVACFSGIGGGAPTSDAVAEFLGERLPLPAVPKRFIAMQRWPLSLNGKLDRAALAARVDEQAHALARADTRWRSHAEEALAGIWKRCLPASAIHRHASFLAIGGTSLLALQVSAQVRRQLRRNLTPIDVLRFPLFCEQARRIEAALSFDGADAAASPSAAQLPLTRAQQTMLAASQLDASGCAYLVHVALHLDAPSDRVAVRRAFARLADRHPALRMTLAVDRDMAHASVRDALPALWWREHDELADPPTDQCWPSALLATINRRLDVAHDGVMRVDFWPVSGGASLLVWTVHHIAIDEASVDRCLHELDRLIAGAELPPVYGSPLVFAAIEKAWADHAAADTWVDRLIGSLTSQPALVDRSPAPGREVTVVIPATLGARLHPACARLSVTPFAPLLAAYGLALQDVFGAPCRFVSTPFSRRIEPELVEPVGCFIDLCFVEAGARAGETLAETLTRVNQSVLQLQRPTFLPHHTIVESIAARDPSVSPHLNAFGFTWRFDPARSLPFGPARARLLRVPQQGARFGVCLHVAMVDGELCCSIEAVESAFVRGHVNAVATAFVRRLEAMCEVSELHVGAVLRDERAASSASGSVELVAVLRASWQRWVGTTSAPIAASTDFLHCGGNSLTVMRMTAQLRREHGLRIDAGAFLARPTFATLCELAGEPPTRSPGHCVIVGPFDARHVLVLIPGKGGQALGLYALAEQMQRRFGDDHAIAIPDLEAMLSQAPQQHALWFLYERIGQLLKELGPQRIGALVGFSLGGILALRLAQQFAGTMRPPVWLLDSYAPRAMARNLWLRIERRLAHSLLRRKHVANRATTQSDDSVSNGMHDGASELEPQWDAIQAELCRESAAAPGVEVHLIQARHTVDHVGLLWRRRTNGFNPKCYAHWYLHEIDAKHLELPRSLAAETAGLFASGLRWA